MTVSSVSGFTSSPYHSRYFRAMASRSRLAPQVMAYWLMSARSAATAASLSTSGAGKLGKPCARLIAPCSAASRVIPRMTDSVKVWVRRAVRMGAYLRMLAPASWATAASVVCAAFKPRRKSASE